MYSVNRMQRFNALKYVVPTEAMDFKRLQNIFRHTAFTGCIVIYTNHYVYLMMGPVRPKRVEFTRKHDITVDSPSNL
jgi:hypothetical protein